MDVVKHPCGGGVKRVIHINEPYFWLENFAAGRTVLESAHVKKSALKVRAQRD